MNAASSSSTCQVEDVQYSWKKSFTVHLCKQITCASLSLDPIESSPLHKVHQLFLIDAASEEVIYCMDVPFFVEQIVDESILKEYPKFKKISTVPSNLKTLKPKNKKQGGFSFVQAIKLNEKPMLFTAKHEGTSVTFQVLEIKVDKQDGGSSSTATEHLSVKSMIKHFDAENVTCFALHHSGTLLVAYGTAVRVFSLVGELPFKQSVNASTPKLHGLKTVDDIKYLTVVATENDERIIAVTPTRIYSYNTKTAAISSEQITTQLLEDFCCCVVNKGKHLLIASGSKIFIRVIHEIGYNKQLRCIDGCFRSTPAEIKALHDDFMYAVVQNSIQLLSLSTLQTKRPLFVHTRAQQTTTNQQQQGLRFILAPHNFLINWTDNKIEIWRPLPLFLNKNGVEDLK